MHEVVTSRASSNCFSHDEKKYIRKLGASERLMYHYSRAHPRHFCVVAELVCNKRLEDFRAAFASVQAKHPMLSVKILVDADGVPSFYYCDDPVSIVMLDLTDNLDWLEVVENELSISFSEESAPLFRATLLMKGDCITVILTFHHAIADGIASAYVVEDLILALDGQKLSALSIPKSYEDRAKSAFPWPRIAEATMSEIDSNMNRFRFLGSRPLWRDFDNDDVSVTAIEFSESSTDGIRLCARQQGTTVHGALCAALAKSVCEITGRNDFTIANPINYRSIVGVPDNSCAMFVGVCAIRMDPVANSEFWIMARHVTEKLSAVRRTTGVISSVNELESFIHPVSDPIMASGLIAGLGYDAVVSNLGNLDIYPTSASIHLNAFWGPAVVGRLVDERMIGASTFRGRLRLVQACPRHIPSNLQAIRVELLNACGIAQ